MSPRPTHSLLSPEPWRDALSFARQLRRRAARPLGVGAAALLLLGSLSPAAAQDPPETHRLNREAPRGGEASREGAASSVKVRRIVRTPREVKADSELEARVTPAGFNRPPEPGAEVDAEAAEALSAREKGEAEDHDAEEGDAMETTTDSDVDAASDETDQLIASALVVARSEAVTRGRVLAREEAALEEEDEAIPDHFVFRAPMRNRKVTSGYGYRYHPLEKRRRGRKRRKKLHKGIDYGAPKGTPILATGPGEVIHAGWGPRGERDPNGRCVFIKHPNGWVSIYLHMSKVDVKEGEVVKGRQQIGRVGSTGRSTGPHLHFQVQKEGRTIDPQKIFGKRSDRIKSP